MVAGCKALGSLPAEATDAQYLEIQNYMDEYHRDAGAWSWGHKYFHMMFPNKLDDFHNEDFQRLYLVKLLSSLRRRRGGTSARRRPGQGAKLAKGGPAE